jgi:hypothetical protein
MICYKDITFCPFWKECKDGSTCKVALTDEVYRKGVEWSRTFTPEDILICQYTDKPDCFKEKNKNARKNY